MSRTDRFAALDLALGELCDRVEYGHLLASTDPVVFVKAVRDRLDAAARLAAALRGLVGRHADQDEYEFAMDAAKAALAEYEKEMEGQ